MTMGARHRAEPPAAPSPPSDLDELWRTVRERIAAERRARAAADEQPAPPDDLLALHIRQAGELADAGSTVPPFANLSWPRRLIARVTARLLIYFLRVVTIDQQRFNRLAVAVLHQLGRDSGALRRAFDALAPQLEAARNERDALLARVGAMADALAAEREQVSAIADALAAEREQMRVQAAALAELRDTSQLLLIQTDALKRRLPLSREAGTAPGPLPAADRTDGAPAPSMDRWLLADTFRGSESSIRDRQRRYLSYFEGCTNVLDVGCGRGEFLHLLREAGIAARGVDVDEDLALWCHERGLAVRCMDGLEYLTELGDGELDGIFCAQVVEHLRTDDLLRFVDLAYQKLRPDGRIVIETLNPESLLVLYRWFWMDLTHERLVHPETLMFLLRSSGFRDVDCDFLPPPPGPLHIPPLHFAADPPPQLQEFNAATQYLNRLLYASFDYAVVAVR